MKYALRCDPGGDTTTTIWFWFQEHGAYYLDSRNQIVYEADPEFIDVNLTPEFSGSVERVSFDDVPEHVHGYDPREIVGLLPREYPDDNGEGPNGEKSATGGNDAR